MAVAIRVRAAAAVARPPLPARQPNETALAALMFFMLLAGVAVLILAGKGDRAPAAPNQRPIEGWVGDTSGAQTAAAPTPLPPTLVPVAVAVAAPPASAGEPVRAAPA
ncbi:MAG: hypothetical protein M3O34_00775, partial [Chloroflexota bacterium]|nr:hypothetical protein [Chloroflexota bacterium]